MSIETIPQPKKPRRYRKITANTIAQLQSELALQGNGSAAIRMLEPDSLAPGKRASDILSKSNNSTGAVYIEQVFQQIAVNAVERVKDMIQSSDERIATKNSHFVIDHVRGQAVKRSESRSIKVSIETVLR